MMQQTRMEHNKTKAQTTTSLIASIKELTVEKSSGLELKVNYTMWLSPE